MKKTFTLRMLLVAGVCGGTAFTNFAFAQNVGIGTAAPAQKLHVSDATTPNAATVRVSGLASTTTVAAGTAPYAVVMVDANGVMSRGGSTGAAGNNAWMVGGNAGLNGGNTTTAGTNFLGTTDNQNIDFRTNNIFRGRISNLGEFFIGTLNTVLTGDLMNGVANAAFPWAVNGYSDQNGSGVYGQVTAGGTIFAGVQGEYNGTHAQGSGVRGIALTTTAGTGFGAAHTGVNGQATTSGTYKYGVFGSGGTSARTGGVMGYDYGISIGALGYYANSAVDYGVYGFGQAYQTGVAGGRGSGQQGVIVGMDQVNTNIGLGIYGGVMGGWVRGMVYGMHVKGERSSLYVDGKTITNEPITQLVTLDGGDRVSTYVPSSTSADVYARGNSKLGNGQTYVQFSDEFKQVFSSPQDLVITVTPRGNCNGVYVSNVDANGFHVQENNGGTSGVDFSWIAMGTRKGSENIQLSPEILQHDFDAHMRNTMRNDMDESTPVDGAIFWDGSDVKYGIPPAKKASNEHEKFVRPGTVPNN
ncbi:MAG: hypothetical protein U0176_22435 [Bacteroidia bacterium]